MVAYLGKGRNNNLALRDTESGGRHQGRGEIALVVLVASLMVGCGSPKMAPIPTKTMGDFTYRTSSDGLEVAVDAWTDPERVKKHFAIDLLSHRIVPFQVAFANVGAEGGFVLQPALAAVLDEKDLQELQSGSSNQVLYQGVPPALTGVVFIASPLLGIGLKAIDDEAAQDARDVQRQIESVRFSDRPLYRSDSNSGFLYLTVDTSDLPKIAAVKFRVKNIRSRQERIMIVPLKRR